MPRGFWVFLPRTPEYSHFKEPVMNLKEFFEANPRLAIAFSGGVDSSYLIYAAKMHGCDVKAYFIKSAFQPQFELDDAMKFAYMHSIPMRIEHVDVLQSGDIVENPADRCFHCKKAVFTKLIEAAREDGYTIICDGTNASDDATERAGMRALEEMGVLSPLREAGLTKAEIRRLSREAGLFTHDKPSYACLATRIPTGTEITQERLDLVATGEELLRTLGFSDFRLRYLGDVARLQVPASQFKLAFEQKNRITAMLKPYFQSVLLDLSPRLTETIS
jgi:uncharacterized protein